MTREPYCSSVVDRIISFGLILAIGFILLVSLSISTAINARLGARP